MAVSAEAVIVVSRSEVVRSTVVLSVITVDVATGLELLQAVAVSRTTAVKNAIILYIDILF